MTRQRSEPRLERLTETQRCQGVCSLPCGDQALRQRTMN